MTKDEMIALAYKAAQVFSLDPSLFSALIENESSWDPHASRYEPAFFNRHIVPLNITDPEEAKGLATSFGLCQIMGQVAREMGFREALVLLYDPEINLHLGAQKLRRCLDKHGGIVVAGLLSYNGGSDKEYPHRVLARQQHYHSLGATPVTVTEGDGA